MRSDRPRIGVPADCKMMGDDPVQSVGDKYLAAVGDAAEAVAVVLPALGAGDESPALERTIGAADQLDGLDGLFLTGSPTNIEPWRYGRVERGVGPFDPRRDSHNLALIAAALARDLPILAVCRGFQELNVACGGTLYPAVHDVPGLLDHREDIEQPRTVRYKARHPLSLAADGWLAAQLGADEIMVNSLHGQGIDRLAPILQAEACAPDGLIEAARHTGRTFVWGVQWHPEWRYADHPASMVLFRAFGEAARAHRRGPVAISA